MSASHQITTSSPAREAVMPCGVFSFVTFPRQPLLCPLVVGFVWQKRAVVQAVDRRQPALLFPQKAMTSWVSWTIITQLGNLTGCGQTIR